MSRFEKIKPPPEYKIVAAIIAEYKKPVKGGRSLWRKMPADLRRSWRVTNRFLEGYDGIRSFEFRAADVVNFHDEYHRLWECPYNTKLLALTKPWKVMCDKLRKVKQRPLPEYKLRELKRSEERRKRKKNPTPWWKF